MSESPDKEGENLSKKSRKIWDLAQNHFFGYNNDEINLGVLFEESQKNFGCTHMEFSEVIKEFTEKGFLKKYLLHCFKCGSLIQDDGSDCPYCGNPSYYNLW